MKTKYILFCAFTLLLFACGQETKNSQKDDGTDDEPRLPRDIEISDFIKNQRLECGENECPDYMAKVVVISDGKPTYCTGTLINSNTVVTSATCIPRTQRIRGKYCSDEIFAIFGGRKTEIAPCKQILEIDDKISFLEPAMWKGDYFFFNLTYDLARSTPKIAKGGITNKESLDLWRVDFENSFVSTIKNDKCLAIQDSYLNPFSDSQAHPMQVVSQCKTTTGSKGAALINSRGEIAGNISQEMSGSLYNFLYNSDVMAGTLGRYHHVTNFSCIKFLGQPIDQKKCNPNLSLSRLDGLRAGILRGSNVSHNDMSSVVQELSQRGKYFKWDFGFDRLANGREFELSINKPVCFRNTDNWIGEFRTRRGAIYNRGIRTLEVPNYSFTTKLDSNLQPQSVLEKKGTKEFTFEFNPWSSRVEDQTFVNLSYDLFEREVTKEFLGVKLCP